MPRGSCQDADFDARTRYSQDHGPYFGSKRIKYAKHRSPQAGPLRKATLLAGSEQGLGPWMGHQLAQFTRFKINGDCS